MSRRGGGRRSESQREQQSPPITMAGERGRGRGRGEGGGGGVRRGGYVASSSTPTIPEVGSTSSLEASLTRDVEQQLSLQSSMPEETRVVTQPPSSSKSLRLPARPGFGTAGSKYNVRANHFIVEILDKDLHHYDVTITPVISKGVNRAVMNQLVGKHRLTELGGRRPAYDGRKSIYTAGALPFESKEFVILLIHRDSKPGPASRKEREFKVAIKFASKVDVSHLQQFLFGRQLDAPQVTIQALDIALRELPSRNYTVVGRSFFSLSLGAKSDGCDGLECWKGFYQSLRPTQMGLSLNVDVGATSFYEPIPVIDFVNKVLGKDPSRLSDVDRAKVKKVLKGVKVHLTHRQDGKCLKVSGITTQSTVNLTFPVDGKGIKMSVVQYFKEKYQIKLQYVNWPALQAGSDTKPIYLPMEVCEIVEGQRYAKKLNEKQVTALLHASCKRPHERERSTEEMVKHNNYSKEDMVKEFGMAVKDELTFIRARVLPAPELKYHDTGRVARIRPSVGQWNMINSKMNNGGTVDSWTCINFSRLGPDKCLQFCRDLVSMCTSKGMVFNRKPVLPLDSAQPNQIEKSLLDLHAKCTAIFASMGMKGKQLKLLIVILPDFSGSGSYGRIKRVCETELGLVSQCCQPTNAAKHNKGYLENVALKINVKVGGRNTALVDRMIPLRPYLPTIIFGADVAHPRPGDDSSPSISAVVGSMDWPEVTKYRALVSSQLHRQEIIQDLYKQSKDDQRGVVHGGMIRELLIAFRRSTNLKPERIIFYRDGVGEGQFNQVLLYEMDAIRKACASLEENYLPRVTFVVVQKRHHTRFFPVIPVGHKNKNLTLADRSGNILPGTVVDSKICHPTQFDFYLCSHAGIQGTSRPTHYHVLWDENNFSADALQLLTNNLCYTYARCTRSVSTVPPVYYANLAAFRARFYIEDSVSDSGPMAGGVTSTRDKSMTIRPLPLIRDNVKDVMFYC